tara:strand:+ start:14851 stop:15477 length:627 start_codon:yes stop_codon:yes gene_type:complete
MNLVMRVKRGKSGGTAATARPRLVALSDPARAPDPFLIARSLPLGAVLIWRAYGMMATRNEVARLARLVHARKGQLMIAGAGHTASLADGIHLAAHRLKGMHTEQSHHPGRRPRTKFQVTAAAHCERDIVAAARAGVDAVLISPVFATASHPGAGTLGPVRFAALAHRATRLGLDVIALGGMTGPAQWRRLKGSAAIGLAGISLFSSR